MHEARSETPARDVAAGLEGIVVAETQLSSVDGVRGELIIAGERVEELAAGPGPGFERTTARLFALGSGVAHDPAELGRALGAARARAHDRLPQVRGALAAADGMDALRGALAQLGASDPIELVGATAVFAAAASRHRAGAEPVPPDSDAPHAADYLRLCTGRVPGAAAAAALDAYLVTVSDHGMNASTFAARVVTSTGSDAVSAVVAAVGALKGPLHGGAPGPVLDMLDAIGTPARARAFIDAELAAGRRIMGMGHRIYRVRDPRALVLERALAALAQGQASPRLALARAVEAAATEALAARHPERPLRANVEFYTAVLLEAVGLDRAAFSSTFAVGRVAGWLAHVAEQRRTGRLIRPASRYVGPPPPAARAIPGA